MRQIYIVSDYLSRPKAAFLSLEKASESVKALSDSTYKVTTVPVLDSACGIFDVMDEYKVVENGDD